MLCMYLSHERVREPDGNRNTTCYNATTGFKIQTTTYKSEYLRDLFITILCTKFSCVLLPELGGITRGLAFAGVLFRCRVAFGTATSPRLFSFSLGLETFLEERNL